MSTTEQAVITGWGHGPPSTTEDEFEQPDTFRYCHACDIEVLRSRFGPHWQHDWEYQMNSDQLYTPGGSVVEDDDDEVDFDDEDDDGNHDPVVGAKYSVRISYSVDYAFTVYEPTENMAKERAKELVNCGNAVDAHSVHTNVDEIMEIHESDDLAEKHDLQI